MALPTLKRTVLAFAAVALMLPANAQQRSPQRPRQRPKPLSAEQVRKTLPAGVMYQADIAYRQGNPAWRLDLAAPEESSAKPRPAIVVVHGGGWTRGDKRMAQWARLPVSYAQYGYVAISVNYRMVTEAPMPACIEDVKCAIRWLRAHARKYNVDPNRIGGYGNSAGAHLVSVAGLALPEAGLDGDGPYREFPSTLQAICASATPTDLARIAEDRGGPRRGAGALRDVPAEKVADIARLSSPITHVRADTPPFLLIHGNADRTVPVIQSERLAKALRTAGAKYVTYLIVDGAGHGAFSQNRTVMYPAMRAFFDHALGQNAEQ